MSEWQPIETAPRDESEILSWNGYVRRTACWDKVDKVFRANSYPFTVIAATQWQPLPEPPEPKP